MKTTCPNCFGNNYAVSSEKGFSYCFNCAYWERDDNNQAKPRIRSPHIEEYRHYYTSLAEYYHSCLDSKAEQYLTNRGYDIGSIERLKLGYCPDEGGDIYSSQIAIESGVADQYHRSFLRGRITFPYIKDGIVTDIRGRALSTEEEIRYLSLRNTAYFRGADVPYNIEDLTGQNDSIVLTEGEIKTGISSQSGIPTIGLPGILSWRKFNIRHGQTVIICFDNSIEHRRELLYAIRKTAYNLDIDYVKVATLPLRGRDKIDIDTYILEEGVDKYKEIIYERSLPFRNWNNIVR